MLNLAKRAGMMLVYVSTVIVLPAILAIIGFLLGVILWAALLALIFKSEEVDPNAA